MLDVTARIKGCLGNKSEEKVIIEYVCSNHSDIEECVIDLIYDKNGIITTYDYMDQNLKNNKNLKEIYDLIVKKMNKNIIIKIFDEIALINKAHGLIYSQLEDHLICIEAKSLDCFMKNCDFKSLKEYEQFKVSIKKEIAKIDNERLLKIKEVKVF